MLSKTNTINTILIRNQNMYSIKHIKKIKYWVYIWILNCLFKFFLTKALLKTSLYPPMPSISFFSIFFICSLVFLVRMLKMMTNRCQRRADSILVKWILLVLLTLSNIINFVFITISLSTILLLKENCRLKWEINSIIILTNTNRLNFSHLLQMRWILYLLQGSYPVSFWLWNVKGSIAWVFEYLLSIL